MTAAQANLLVPLRHRTSMQTNIQTSSYHFVILATITGLISAFVSPIMTFFLVEGLQLPPFYIAIYSVVVTFATVVMSQVLGAFSDRGVSSKQMFLIAVTCWGGIGLLYSSASSFMAIMLTAILLMPFAGAAVPQALTLARFWADHNSKDVPTFNARVRAGFSVAWIIGPPSAYFLVSKFGFSASFSAATLIALLAIFYMLVFIPSVTNPDKDKTTESATTDLSFWLLAVAICLGMMSNLIYASALPLYLTRELNLSPTIPGLLMGLVAACEIPIMLVSAKLGARFGLFRVFCSAFVFAIVFFIAMYFANDIWHFFALQLVNALFFGFYAGLGLTLLQRACPNKTGFTSALYSNLMKIGVMLGTSITGFVGQFDQFKQANLVAAFSAVLALACLFAHAYLKRQQPPA